ncbi:MAG: hypothetical protein QRY74_00060 [Chlamydia sp.]
MSDTYRSYRDCLTNEELYNERKESQFDIINRAIQVATKRVLSGNDSMLIDNVAYDTLSDLADGTIE